MTFAVDRSGRPEPLRLALWVLICAAAEFLGIGAAAAWYGAVVSFFGEPSAILPRIGVWFMATSAAVPEGLVLGGLQAFALRWLWPTLSMRRWIVATILVGLAGWGVGTFIPLFLFPDGPDGPSVDPPLAQVAVFAAIFGALAGVLFGLMQAWALPSGVGPRWRWVLGNALGWGTGLPLIYVLAQIGGDLPDVASRIGAWMLGGAGAGLCIGLATAWAIATMRRA